MGIYVRRGMEADFDPEKMKPGEWAVSINTDRRKQKIWMCFAPGVVKRMGTYEDFADQIEDATDEIKNKYLETFNEILKDMKTNKDLVETDYNFVKEFKELLENTYMQEIAASVKAASSSAASASTSASSASTSATAAADSAEEAESYAASWKGSLLPQGVVAFSELPTSGLVAGHLYAVKDKFITDSRFEEGAGHPYPQGTCVYWTKDNKWKVLSGVLSLELTKAEYDALTDAQKKNGTIYYVKDADNLIEADGINGLAVVATSGNYNDLSNKPVMDEKLDKNTAGGIAMCSGGGKYQYFKIATIKITSSYINRPIVFELSGRGKLFSLVTIRFASTSSNDPTLEVFQTNQDRDFYIKKTGTSTWEVYGTYNELWGSYCLHRISGIGADIGIAVNMNNVSALPENCRQAVFGGCAGSVNGHSVNSDVPANAKFTDTTYAVGTISTAGLTKLYQTVGNAADGTMTQAAINAKFYDNGTSRTANTVLSAPNGSAGPAKFRKLVMADLPIKQLTATQYAALSESEKKNGTIYLVN